MVHSPVMIAKPLLQLLEALAEPGERHGVGPGARPRTIPHEAELDPPPLIWSISATLMASGPGGGTAEVTSVP